MNPNKISCCDFCNEIQKQEEYIFKSIYKDVDSRIVGQNKLFVVLPTIGPLFKHSLLILPKRHIETMAELSTDEMALFEDLLQKVKSLLSDYGNVIIFEHGAKELTGGSCGIYHAHIHIVPIPSELNPSQFLDGRSNIRQYNNLTECYKSLDGVSQYLMTVSTDGRIYATDISNGSVKYPSQFFRQKLADYYQLSRSWNWRNSQHIDEYVLETIEEIHIS